MKENIRPTGVQLSAKELSEINDTVSNITVEGARYSADRQRLINR
ncbi:MAG: hypothetical protein ACRD3W_19440 [Terriglobales bacterium]